MHPRPDQILASHRLRAAGSLSSGQGFGEGARTGVLEEDDLGPGIGAEGQGHRAAAPPQVPQEVHLQAHEVVGLAAGQQAEGLMPGHDPAPAGQLQAPDVFCDGVDGRHRGAAGNEIGDDLPQPAAHRRLPLRVRGRRAARH